MRLDGLKISNHFLERCEYRAPNLVKPNNIKNGEFRLKPNLPELMTQLAITEEIERPKSISRLINGDTCKYYCTLREATTPSKMLLFVVDNNTLITVYKYLDSWAYHGNQSTKKAIL